MSSVGASTSLETAVSAIAVPASGSWDGNDGPWSTFDIHIGTPPQSVRVLVSTTATETWAVSANKTQGGCLLTDLPDCPKLRGGLVNVNTSSTWHDQGIYALGLETNLPDYDGLYDNGDYGFDALGLGPPGFGGVSFKSQTIAVIATKDIYLGTLGVNPHPVNFTSFSNPEVSFLSSIKQSNSAPSLSFAYSAGARYRQNTLATLTLGGYDASKFTPTSNASFVMAEDISRDLVVGLQAVIANNAANKALLPNGIWAFIDATVPHIWLPRDSCSLFEDVFGIVYDASVNRYLVNETLHSKLQSENTSVSFLLGPGPTGRATVNVTLPYGSFDLETGPPTVNATQRYFPLRRADNESQYTLGRTFLQEAYLIVDYERNIFSVYQNAWPASTTPDIVGIAAVDAVPSANSTVPNHVTPPGAIAGVVVGVIALCGIGISIALFCLRKQRAARNLREKMDVKAEDSDAYSGKPEMDGNGKALGELDAFAPLPEADSITPLEMPGSSTDPVSPAMHQSELAGSKVGSELKGTLGSVEKDEDSKGA